MDRPMCKAEGCPNVAMKRNARQFRKVCQRHRRKNHEKKVEESKKQSVGDMAHHAARAVDFKGMSVRSMLRGE